MEVTRNEGHAAKEGTTGHGTGHPQAGSGHAVSGGGSGHSSPPPDALQDATTATQGDVTTLYGLLSNPSPDLSAIDSAFIQAHSDLKGMMYAKAHKIPD